MLLDILPQFTTLLSYSALESEDYLSSLITLKPVFKTLQCPSQSSIFTAEDLEYQLSFLETT